MQKTTILINGCDAAFYPFMQESLKSLIALNMDKKAELGILDLGLLPEQLAELQRFGCIIRTPEWTMGVPEHLRNPKQLGLVARTALRDYFPGYKTYIWFDADAWAQTLEFFDLMVDGAQARGAAVIRENGSGYHRNMMYRRWWYGHMIATYGPVSGFAQAFPPAINIGIMALSDTAPHWRAWRRHYKCFIRKRGKINLDQHAFNAALEFDNLPQALLPARCNWICTLSPPRWDEERRQFCEPNASRAPLSVLHLAGPDKRRAYAIPRFAGGTLKTPLTYDAYVSLSDLTAPLKFDDPQTPAARKFV